jgi:hypothetical protein
LTNLNANPLGLDSNHPHPIVWQAAANKRIGILNFFSPLDLACISKATLREFFSSVCEFSGLLPKMADENPLDIVPDADTGLRACLGCHLVKTFDQFVDAGCDNCPDLELAQDRQRTARCTSTAFEGLVSAMRPTESWVARWNSLS